MSNIILLSAATNPSENDANLFVFIFLLILAIPLTGYVVYALATGSILGFAGHRTLRIQRYMRDARPVSYWTQVMSYLLIAGALLYAAYELYREGFGTFFR